MRSMATHDTNRMLAAAASACEDKKAEDIRILALDPAESGLTDYFLICNGTNDRQNLAIADEVELRLKRDFSTYPNSIEGRRQADWILLDYVDFIVHVFSAEKRAFYGLERLRKSATTLSLDDLNTEIKRQIAAGRKKHASANSSFRTQSRAAAKSSSTSRTRPVSPSSKGRRGPSTQKAKQSQGSASKKKKASQKKSSKK